MADRRYSEGGTPPVLNFPDRRDVYTYQEAMARKRRHRLIVPVDSSALSGTSDAAMCFVNRQNSELLQRFLLNYSYNLIRSTVLSGEV